MLTNCNPTRPLNSDAARYSRAAPVSSTLTVTDMQSILTANKSNLALIVGNGINRYGGTGNSWNGLLQQLADKYTPGISIHKSGISLTEFYDVLELKSSATSLQKQFCDLMKSWSPEAHHRRVVNWAQLNNVPILTTNFERVLADCGNFQRHRSTKGKFTAYYPWETYFGPEGISNPSNSFGIWHINGTQEYRQSIRLGLSHYMGSVQRARAWLHRGGDKRLFSGKSHDTWRGSKTWLKMIFGSDILIFGLGLEENEVFLRWLLIERARYFRKYPTNQRKAWYVHVNDRGAIDDGKKLFFNCLGINIISVSNHDEVYGEKVWK